MFESDAFRYVRLGRSDRVSRCRRTPAPSSSLRPKGKAVFVGPEVQRIFAMAVELPPAERESLVRRECGNDPRLFREVMSLLQAYEDHLDDDYLEKPVFEVGKLWQDAYQESEQLKKREQVPPTIPGYTIIEHLGNGAMGQVYLARQDELARPVAVKVLRPLALDRHYDEFVVRFRNECKVLAMLPHKNIAKLYDVGSLADDRPFFTMEYLEGAQTVQQFCDETRAGIEQRLQLFLEICDGVAFAHRNAIVHRDLKPSNILVDPKSHRPLIIDFGIAKSIQPHEAIDFTETPEWRPMGTPPFISPEQLRRTKDGVTDTRSDVYALGMVLYVLLTDQRPFINHGDATYDFDLLKKIIETPAPAPSQAFLQQTATCRGEVAAKRGLTPAQLARLLRRDLDWVVLKAIRKNPDERYQSVLALADDVRRFLALQPVKARPDVWFYPFSKFVRRHWAAVTVGALFAVSLLTVATIAFFNNQKAIRAGARTRAVLTNLRSVVDINDPLFPDLVRVDTARTIVDKLGVGIEEFDDDEMRLTLMEIQASLLYSIGDYRAAKDRFSAIYRANLRRLGPDHKSTIIAAYWAGICSVGLKQSDEALAFFDIVLPYSRVLEQRFQFRLRRARVEALRELGLTDSSVLIDELNAMAAGLHDLQGEHSAEAVLIAISKGHVYRDSFQFDKAEEAYLQALTLRLDNELVSDPIRGNTYNYLAANARAQGAPEKALTFGREGRRLLEGSLPPDHPYLLSLYNNLGNVFADLGRYEEAEPLLREALLLKPTHELYTKPLQTNMLNNLADLYLDWDCVAEAETVKLIELTLRGQAASPRDLNHLASYLTLAEIYALRGRHAETVALLEAVIADWPAGAHREYQGVALVLLSLAEARQGRVTRAFDYFCQARDLSGPAAAHFAEYYCESARGLASLPLTPQQTEQVRAALTTFCGSGGR